ncbi:SDR family NAD(P)-dependent oxidoreductase [Enterovirga aerilata]|uniref:SDR family oxidoreductase n=1 Tax=Enterovirga aerilata TaxID=2730920 RepID=A0A849ICG9_9HYPH|nr:SDR family oxidoreductase [Enterovirga sp. DB1703]
MALEGRNIILTGGASGIGRATALLLARNGARVFVGDRNQEAGAELLAEARTEGLAIQFGALDITDMESARRFVGGVHEQVGRADALVNVAGWDQVEPFLQNTPDLWDKLLDINLKGVIRMSRLVLDPMIEARRGRIVNIASDAGRVGSMGEVVYSSAKGGQIAFTKALAREMARHNITVNCVCPGPTETPLMFAQVGENAAKIVQGMLRAIPLGRLAQPEDISGPIMFFLEDRAAYITGQVLSVSGGLTMVD